MAQAKGMTELVYRNIAEDKVRYAISEIAAGNVVARESAAIDARM